jgi:hypothetical protein
MPKPPSPEAYLLVEGKNDRHVIQHLCQEHGLPTFSIRTPDEGGGEGGINELLEGIPLRLKDPALQTLGIVVDADSDLKARWQAVRNRLVSSGYHSIPALPVANGWISSEPDLPRVGVWLMPDNHLPGMLEDFVAMLIPHGDPLHSKAENVLAEIERAGLHRYPDIHQPKALIHTWLAWQEIPGQPMGLAITARALRHDMPLALDFIAWLRRLFGFTSTLVV